MGADLREELFLAAVLREDLLPAVLFRADDFLVTEGLAGGIVSVAGRTLNRAVMAGFVSGIRAFRDPRRDFAAGRFRSVVTGRGGILGGAGREGEYQRGSAGAG